MLQIHDILSLLDRDLENNLFKVDGDHGIYNMFYKFLKTGGACFDFGDLSTIPEDTWTASVLYSNELINNHIFQLPYPSVYYSFSMGNLVGVLISQVDDTTFYSVIVSAIKPPITICNITACLFEFQENDDNRRVLMSVAPENVFSNPRYNLKGSKGEFPSKLISTTTMNTVLMTTGFLNSRHVRTREHALAPKQNEKRVKRGLLPIMPYHTVYFDVDGKSYNTDGSLRGGTHASPRMHWRRGHVRNMASGKLVHVRPHLVCAGVDKEVQVPKPQYKLRTGK